MKPAQTNEPANRREFFRGSVRYALLAGLAAVSAVLVRKRGAPLAGQTCVNRGFCRGCGAVTDCGLPQALSFKHATHRRPS